MKSSGPSMNRQSLFLLDVMASDRRKQRLLASGPGAIPIQQRFALLIRFAGELAVGQPPLQHSMRRLPRKVLPIV